MDHHRMKKRKNDQPNDEDQLDDEPIEKKGGKIKTVYGVNNQKFYIHPNNKTDADADADSEVGWPS